MSIYLNQLGNLLPSCPPKLRSSYTVEKKPAFDVPVEPIHLIICLIWVDFGEKSVIWLPDQGS
jgi:hypothetical protein